MAAFLSQLFKFPSATTRIISSSKLANSWNESTQCACLATAARNRLTKVNIGDIPRPPKKPWGAYVVFAVSKMNEIRNAQPGLKFAEVSRQSGEAWNKLSEQEKKVYQDNYSKEAVEFKTQKEQWWNSLSEDQRKRFEEYQQFEMERKGRAQHRKEQKALNKPKRARVAYTFFIAEYGKGQTTSTVKWIESAAKKWNSLSEKDKEPYIALAKEDAKRYESEMRQWAKKI